jgi:uncharacterized membrane protein
MLPATTDHRDTSFQIAVSRLLRAGVAASALVVFAGLTFDLWRHGAAKPHYRVFAGEPAEFRSLGGILRGAAALDPRAWIQFGLLLLIATPVARVVFSAVMFALERERLYVVLTVIVLSALVYSLAGGYR